MEEIEQVCMYVCIHVCMYLNHGGNREGMYVCMYVCMHTCMYVFKPWRNWAEGMSSWCDPGMSTYIHTHIHNGIFSWSDRCNTVSVVAYTMYKHLFSIQWEEDPLACPQVPSVQHSLKNILHNVQTPLHRRYVCMHICMYVCTNTSA